MTNRRLVVIGIVIVLISVFLGEFAERIVHNFMIEQYERGEWTTSDIHVDVIGISFFYRPAFSAMIAICLFLASWFFVTRDFWSLDRRAVASMLLAASISAVLSFLYAYIEILRLGRFWP
jgi:hypothetical protein